MAAPGIGVGDIVLLCQTIVRYARRYKDAPEDFDEIAIKASSTATLLARIDREVQRDGNIVAREGPEALTQLEETLASLRKDSKRLENLVLRYNKIHDEGYGRRMVWAFKESGNIDELRRAIGLHEQSLQLWYMTVMTGSLRRLEIGQAEMRKDQAALMKEMLKGIEFAKALSPSQKLEIKNSIRRGDSTVLADVLKKNKIGVSPPTRLTDQRPLHASKPPMNKPSRLSSEGSSNYFSRIHDYERPSSSTRPQAQFIIQEEKLDPKTSEQAVFNETLQAVSDYILADAVEKMELESRIRTTASTIAAEPPPPKIFPEDSYEYITGVPPRVSKTREPNIFTELHRSKSTGDERKRRTYETKYDREILDKPTKSTGFTSLLTVPGESHKPRRLSDADLIIKSTTKSRTKSPEPLIYRSNSHNRPTTPIILFEPRTPNRYEDKSPKPIILERRTSKSTDLDSDTYEEIIASRPGPPHHSHSRSNSNSHSRSRSYSRSRPIVDFSPREDEAKRYRSSSRHSDQSDGGRSDVSKAQSYDRRRSSSRGGEGGRGEREYFIKKMERIDSLDIRDGH